MNQANEKRQKFELEVKENLSKIKNLMSFFKKYKTGIIALISVILIVTISLSVIFSKERNIITIAESSLKEVVETSELSTLEYIYNSTVAMKNENDSTKYYVAYEGTVKAGFDFNNIIIEKNKNAKKIVITIPEIKINSVNINDKTLDFIFVDDKYDTETTFQEAYKLCYSDLDAKAKSNKSIKEMAYENALDVMKAIVMPLEQNLPDGYTFEFKKVGEVK